MDVQMMTQVGSAAIEFGVPAVIVAIIITLSFLKSFRSNQRDNPNHRPSVPSTLQFFLSS